MIACAVGAAMVMGMTACGDTGQETKQEGAGTASAGEAVEGESTEGTVEAPADLDYTVDLEGIATEKISAGASVHDPSIFKADGKYYIFGSHMSTAVSEDLRNWTPIGTGYKVKECATTTRLSPNFQDSGGVVFVNHG